MSKDSEVPSQRLHLMQGLWHAFQWMDEGMQNHLRAAGHEPLSRTQAMIVSHIGNGMTRPSELARELGVSRQAVHQLLADMEARDLVELLADPSDARAKIVRFKRWGKDVARFSLQATAELEALIGERIGKKPLAELKRILLDTDWGKVSAPAPARSVRKSASKAVDKKDAVRRKRKAAALR